MNTPPITRRTALKTTAAGLASALTAPLWANAPAPAPLAYSTLGCPKWDLNTILKMAVSAGYGAVEFRGLLGELDLPKTPTFGSPDRIAGVRTQFAEAGVRIVNLGSSARLHVADPTQRTQQLDEARRYIDLAHALGCPFVRVFPDQLPPDKPQADTLALIRDGLLSLAEQARPAGVTVLLETHGDLTRSEQVAQLMEAARHPQVGLIWDIVNMWLMTKEPPATVYQRLRPYIRHVHVKDLVISGDKHRYVLTGTGQAPLREALQALRRGGYTGHYSFEWEKWWHPDIDEPERAIPHYPGAISELMA
jgi:sugar phosphate isomerase/epimerase